MLEQPLIRDGKRVRQSVIPLQVGVPRHQIEHMGRGIALKEIPSICENINVSITMLVLKVMLLYEL